MQNNIWFFLRLFTFALLPLPSVAAPPAKGSIAQFTLGAPYDAVIKLIGDALPDCSAETRTYRRDETGSEPPGQVIAGADLREIDVPCYTRQLAENGKVDHWQFDFVHARIDARSPTYSITLTRNFKTPVTRLEATDLRQVRQELFSAFGSPTVEGPSSLQRSTGPSAARTGALRTQGTTLWWGSGKWDPTVGMCVSECGAISLTASITYVSANDQLPVKNRVQSLVLRLLDNDLFSRHAEWLHSQQQRESKERTRF